MRKHRHTTLAILAGVCAFATAGSAGATSVILEWTGAAGGFGVYGLGGDSVDVIAPQFPTTLTLDIQLNVDSRGTSGTFLSIEFDTDLGNELNVISFQEIPWSNPKGLTLQPLNAGIAASQESFDRPGPKPKPLFTEGQLYTFEGTSTGNGPANTTLTFARVVFVTNPGKVASDGDDVFSGAFNPGVDGVFDNTTPLAQDITTSVTFGAGSVNIPEPSTFTLLALGLGAVGLAAAPRRRRR